MTGEFSQTDFSQNHTHIQPVAMALKTPQFKDQQELFQSQMLQRRDKSELEAAIIEKRGTFV